MTPDQLRLRPWLQIRSDVAGVDAENGVWMAHLDGRSGRAEPEFLDAIADTLQFPEYYGRNWGALHECFRDLFDVGEGGMGSAWGGTEGRPEHTLHLVVHHAEDLLVDDDPRYLGIVLDYFRKPFHTYDPPQPWHRWAGFRATFLCAPDAWESFADRLHVAGFQFRDLML